MSTVLPTRESKATSQPPPATNQPPSPTDIVIGSLVVEVPFVRLGDSGNYQDSNPHRRLDLGLIGSDQMRKIKAIRRGYIAQGKLLANGQEVKSNRDALLCLVESLEV